MHIPSLVSRFIPTGALVALSLSAASSLHAQAQFAGTYTGTINTRVVVPVIGTTVENSVGGYMAVVAADGTINVSGTLTGTVNASGQVTFTGGTALATLNIRTATIANNQLSSAYGDPVAGSNGTTSFRFNASTSFQAASGGGTGGGGTGGGGTGGGGTAGGDLLAYYSFNDANNLLRDDSGRGFTLAPVGGVVTSTAGRIGAGALRTNGVRLRTLVNRGFSATAMTISFFVRPTGAGNWNPRLVAIGYPGQSAHYYGVFLDGLTTTRRFAFLANTQIAQQINSTNRLNNDTWYHVAATFQNGTLTLYRDGQVDSTTNTGRALTTFSSAMMMIAGSDNGLDLFQGDLDEVRIYNRALTAAEIGTLNTGGTVGSAVTTDINTAAAIPQNAISAPYSLTGFRNRVGQSFELTVTGANSGAVWGTDVYTDDSSVAAAAVHAGLLSVTETKTLTVTILPGQGNYAASTRNGITSASWGAWSGSFSFAGTAGTPFSATAAPVIPSVPTGVIAAALNVIPGGRFVLPVTVTGTGPFTYQWFLNGTAIAGATANPYVVNTVTAANAGTYTVRVGGPGGQSPIISVGTLTVPPNANAPQIVLQPFDKIVSPGDTFALATSALGSGVTYQWLRNGNPISAAAGGTGPILLRQGVDSTDAGVYSVRITGGGSTVTTTNATVEINPNASRLANLSGRISIAGNAQVIPGFFVAGTGKKRVLVRAVGPGLAAFGVGGTMADPKLELYDGNRKIDENNNWAAANAAIFTAVGAFGLPANSNDAALVAELDAGKSYTMIVSSNNGQGGVVLFEVYDAGNVSGGSKFTNVSVRGPTGTGNSTLILGFNIQGVGKRTLLARGVGPQLAAFGVSAIADPKLEIFDSNTRSVLANDNWNGADFVTEMLQAREFVGAFALDGGSADASTLALLDPGSYTMQINAASGAVGAEALVELYEVP